MFEGNKSKLFLLKENLENMGIMLVYEGPVNQPLLTELSELIRMQMEKETTATVVTKVTVIFIEQLQNIMNYSDERVQDDSGRSAGTGICAIGRAGDSYVLMSGNQVTMEQKAILQEKLGKIREMDQDELKTMFKEQRRKARVEGAKGAGLGFIDMARKANRIIDYEFNDIDEEHSFLNLKVYV